MEIIHNTYAQAIWLKAQAKKSGMKQSFPLWKGLYVYTSDFPYFRFKFLIILTPFKGEKLCFMPLFSAQALSHLTHGPAQKSGIKEFFPFNRVENLIRKPTK